MRQEDINQQALCQVGLWSIGDFGDHLTVNNVEEIPEQVSEGAVLDLIHSILIATTSNTVCSMHPCCLHHVDYIPDHALLCVYVTDEAEHTHSIELGPHSRHGLFNFHC